MARARRVARVGAAVALGGLVAVLAWALLGGGPDAERDLLTPEERAWLDAHDGAVRLVPCPTYPPVHFYDDRGKARGISEDYVRLLERRLGFRFARLRVDSFDDGLAALRDGRADVGTCLAMTPERARFLHFYPPHVHITKVIVVQKGRKGRYTLEKLRGLRVAMIEGYAEVAPITERHPDLDVVFVPDELTALRQLSFGEVDAAIMDVGVASWHIEQQGISNLRIAGETGVTLELRFASRTDLTPLVSILEKGLASIGPEERAAIYQRWVHVGAKPFYHARKFWLWLAGVAAVLLSALLAMLVWNRMLGSRVRQVTTHLRESEERYRGLVENSPIAIMVHGGERFLFLNEAAVRLHGAKRAEELVGRHLDERLLPEERPIVQALLQQARGSRDDPGTVYRTRVRISRLDGEHADIDTTSFPVSFAGQRAWMSVLVDVSEQTRAEEEVRRMKEQVRHTQKLESLGVLAGGIAHDFNNLLLAILGNADLAVGAVAPEAPAQANLAEIMGAARRASDLCNQMLAYAGRSAVVVEPTDLSALVREMGSILDVSVSKKARLSYEFEEDLPQVEVDATQVRQVVMNLITNASEAIGDGEGTVTVRTRARHCDRRFLAEAYLGEKLAPGLYVTLEVTDDGCGMDRETLDKIFEPFFTTKFDGRGLGMAAVLGIVRGHQGAVHIRSAPGQGTTFQVLFPPAKAAARPVVAAAPDAPWRGSGTVLLVDDDESVRLVGATMLKRVGFQVLTAVDGQEAVDIVRQRGDELTLVILDLTMPRMDGEEAFAELLRLRPTLPVLISSGYAEQDVAGRFADTPPAGFLQKPYEVAALTRALRGVLG